MISKKPRFCGAPHASPNKEAADFPVGNPNIITRKDGKRYTMKTDLNRFLFPKEWTAMYQQLNGDAAVGVELLLQTGARINEARHIKPKQDIDYDNNRVTLRVTKCRAAKGEKQGKVRIIPISTEYSKRLKSLYAGHGTQDYVRMLSTPGMAGALKRAGLRAGVKGWREFSAHTLRKTFEVWLIALGVQPMAITAHMGHDLRTAMSNYVSPDCLTHEEKQHIRSLLGDLYRPKGNQQVMY